ncbi:MAG: DUF6677 family protein [Planctomycetota bacterium]
MKKKFWNDSYILLVLAALTLPGLGQYYAGSRKKGLLSFFLLTALFFWGWWLVSFEMLDLLLPQLQIPCFPGFFLLGISFTFPRDSFVSPDYQHYQPIHYELGMLCLLIVTFLNLMIFFDSLEFLYWKKMSVPLREELPFGETYFRFWLKKISFLGTIGLWINLFFLAEDPIKLASAFPLCYIISCIYQICHFENLSRIFWETERMYLLLSYSLLGFYLLLLMI